MTIARSPVRPQSTAIRLEIVRRVALLIMIAAPCISLFQRTVADRTASVAVDSVSADGSSQPEQLSELLESGAECCVSHASFRSSSSEVGTKEAVFCGVQTHAVRIPDRHGWR